MEVKGNDVFKEDYQIGDPDLFRCVEKYYLEGLQRQATQRGVDIKLYWLDQVAGLEIRGTRQEEVTQMLEYVKDVVRSIKAEITQLEDGDFFFTDEGKKSMEDLERRHHVVLKVDNTVRTAKTIPQGAVTLYQWTFPDNKQLFICRGKAEETGASVVTDAYETSKDIDFKEQWKNKKAFVKFPVPNFKKPGQRKRLRKLVWDLFEKFCVDGLKTFAIAVDTCQSWPLKDFTEIVLASFVDYYLSDGCPIEFQLYLCDTQSSSDSALVLKCCNDKLFDKDVRDFAFKQINEPTVKKNKEMVKIDVLQGDICRIQADMIVNTISPDLDLARGKASKALSRAAGYELQRDLRTIYKHGLDNGQTAVTAGYRLPCRYVLHGVLDKYEDKTCGQTYKTAEDFYQTSVHSFMKNCLTEAERLGCSTISFPVIGTGSLFYPVYIVAKQMFETVQGYESNSKLQSVNIVIFDNDKEVLQMFKDLKRKHDSKHREVQLPEQSKIPKAKLLKIAGTDEGIKAAKDEISKLIKEGESGKTGECSPILRPGQKLNEEPENNAGANNKSFHRKSASRSLRNSSTNKHPMETSCSSVTTPTSPDELVRSRSGNDMFQKQSADITRTNREDEMATSRRSPKKENGQYVSGRVPSVEGRSKFDLSVDVTNGKREITEYGQDKREICKVRNIQAEIIIFFLSDTIEKYVKMGCLLEYDEKERVIVLHGVANCRGFDVNSVKMDVANAVKKIQKELQSMPVDVRTYDRDTIKKHADELSKGDVLCCVDKSAQEITIHGYSFEKIKHTAHQLKARLGIIQETDRRNRSFPSTTEDLSDRGKRATNRIDGKDDHTLSAGISRTGGARPKSRNSKERFSSFLDTECEEMAPSIRSPKRETGQYISGRVPSVEGRSKFDLSVDVTNGKREITEYGQDKREIFKVRNIQAELINVFLSDTFEKYVKMGCLLEYDEKERVIVLHGVANCRGFDVNSVKMDVTNAVKKIQKELRMPVGVRRYDRETIQKHADELTKRCVLCCVDKSAQEMTIHGYSFEKIDHTAHQLKTRLGIIQETDRRNTSFPSTTEDSSDRDKSASLRNNGKDEHPSSAGISRTGGARPKIQKLEKQFSSSSDAEHVETFQIGKIMVQVYKADIRNLPVDCIVNAANGKLQHGGGIAKVISDAAGRELNRESLNYVKTHGDLEVGTVCHTTAGRLRYKCVIHAVGPNWHDYRPYDKANVRECEKDLRSAVVNSIKKAEELGLKSIAIPGISAGIFACPKDLCFIQYSRAVWDYTKQARDDKMVREVHFVDINADIVKRIQHIFKEMGKKGNVPKWYDIHQIVDEAQKKSKEKAENRLHPERKPPQSKRNERNTRSSKPIEESGYPYLSSKPVPGDGKAEFVCVVSPKLSMYVYTAKMLDILNHVDIFACGEKSQGKVSGTVSKSMEQWCDSKFSDEKRRKMKSAKEGDVVLVPVSTATLKFVAFVILYQKENTKTEDDRRRKMAGIYKKLFMEAKKKNCKQLALPLAGTGKGKLNTGFATERLCEGLWAFSKENPTYELTVHLINTDSKKTNESIETVKTLVDKMDEKKKPSGNINHPGKHGQVGGNQSKTNSKPAKRGRPQSANTYRSGNHGEHDNGSKRLHGTSRTQSFSMTAPADKEDPPFAKNESSSEEESEEESEGQLDSDETREDEVIVLDGESPDTDKPDSCVICMETLKHPRRLDCGHEFCEDCIEEQFVYKEACPICGRVCGLIKGDQPEGDMQVTVNKDKWCAGYEKYGRIEITYRFPDGKQGPDHPKPGQWYKGITRTSFLPDNKQGKLILEMLKIAFDRKLVFTIGSSRTTGQEGVITWNDIHHKTDPKPNTQFGYPDPSYLDRVMEELAVKGVTEKDVKTAAGK